MPYGRSNPRRGELSEYENSMECDAKRMEGVIRELERTGDYTVDEIMSRYRSVMTGNSVGVYAEMLARGLERSGHERTASAYRSAAKRLIGFNGGRDLQLEHITAGLVGDFQQSLKAEEKSMNTISFYMRTLRAIYNKAVADGRIPRRMDSPFAGVTRVCRRHGSWPSRPTSWRGSRSSTRLLRLEVGWVHDDFDYENSHGRKHTEFKADLIYAKLGFAF